MVYVTAGIYGEWERYNRLLRKINLKEDDILYVLGDVMDYGEQGMEVLTDMSMRANVYPIAGERELQALRMLTAVDKMLREGTAPDPEFATELTAWASEGGMSTLTGFRALDEEMREGVLDYLSEFALYEEVEVKGKNFVLVHAGIADFDPDTDLEDYEPEDFFTPAPAGASFYADRALVVGHVPTDSGKIEYEDGIVRIDCGVMQGGSLAALCLDNGEEFYV